jgi:methyl-accepting chemotaxis protein
MNKFQLSSIRTRLLAVVVLSVIVAIAIGAVAHLGLVKVADSSHEIVDRADPAITMGTTRTNWAQFETVVNGAITVNSSDGKDRAMLDAEASSRAILAGMDAYVAGHPGAEQEQIIAEKARPAALEAIKAWNQKIKPIAIAAVSKDQSIYVEYDIAKSEHFETPAYVVDVALDEVSRLDQRAIDKTVAEAESTANRSVLQMWSMVFIGALLALGFGAALAGSITRPLRKTVAVLEEVAGGDLTKRLDVNRKDELGQMATALNTTLSTVHDVVSQLESDADRLLTYATRVSEDSSSASDAVAKVSEQLGKVQASSDMLGSSVRDLATVRASDLAPSVDAIARQVNALHDALAGTELSEAVTSGAELTDENKATAAELAEMAGNLNAMISLFILRHDDDETARI